MARMTEEEFMKLLEDAPDSVILEYGNEKMPSVVRAYGNIAQVSASGTKLKPGHKFVTISEPINREISEHDDQVLLFNLLRSLERDYPVLEYVFAVPNGGYRPVSTGKKMKMEGARAGVPDIWVPVPMRSKNGMVIEMKRGYKRGKNKPSDDQVKWMNMMADMNWLAFVAYHRETARKLIMSYLDLPDIGFGIDI